MMIDRRMIDQFTTGWLPDEPRTLRVFFQSGVQHGPIVIRTGEGVTLSDEHGNMLALELMDTDSGVDGVEDLHVTLLATKDLGHSISITKTKTPY